MSQVPPSPLSIVVRRLRSTAAVAALLVLVATVGYVVIAGFDWFDALYMTIITLATVGYGEVKPLHTAGRWWTLLVIVSGFAVFVNTTARLSALLLSGELTQASARRRSYLMRTNLSNHAIVIGFGRVGRATTKALLDAGVAVAVIDHRGVNAEEIERIGAVHIGGDGRDTEALLDAGIERASSIATTLDDPDNVVVTMTARTLRTDVTIVARANDSAWTERLKLAGATKVVPIYETAGANLASTLVTPAVLGVSALAGLDMQTQELLVGADSAGVGCRLSELMAAHPDLVLVGVRRDAALSRWHEFEGALAAGDIVVAMGSAGSLRAFDAALGTRASD